MFKIDKRKEAISLRVVERKSLEEISKTLGIAKSTASLWLRLYPLSDIEIKERHLKADKRVPDQRFSDISSIKKGKAAEHLFIFACLLRDLNCFAPVTEDGRVDFIVGSRLQRAQVKVINEATNTIPMRKMAYNSKTSKKIYRYSADDVDFIVGVNLISMEIYVVPIDICMTYKSCISVSSLGNKYSVLPNDLESLR